MKYEKLLLDLLERVAFLEEKVSELERSQIELEINEVVDTSAKTDIAGDAVVGKQSNRALVLQEVTNILRDKHGFDVQKGKRADGGGLILFKYGRKSHLKILVSRNYMVQPVEPDYEWGGWHTFVPNENDQFDYYVFAVKIDENHPAHYFIFDKNKMSEIFGQKEADSNGYVHFYFRKRWNGKLVDAREEEVDMSAFYNNWNLIC